MRTSKQLTNQFRRWCKSSWSPSEALILESDLYLARFHEEDFVTESEHKNSLIYLINSRLGLNRPLFRKFIDNAASLKITFNYHNKLKIEEIIAHPELKLEDWLVNLYPNTKELIKLVKEVDGTKNKDVKNLDVILQDDPKMPQVIESIYCSFLYYATYEKATHQALNPDCRLNYQSSYFEHLSKYHTDQIDRSNGLTIVDVKDIIENQNNYENVLSVTFEIIENIYDTLDNHSYVAFIVSESINNKWALISDISIYCEKFIQSKIDKAYFRSKEIKQITSDYISKLNLTQKDFDIANDGFHYKDCYLTYDKNNSENIVLLFEKNCRDEALIPCPKCRAKTVQGNSYPILGVRSWECENTFCGDKSKYNRGKRYSLSSVIRQQALFDDRNIISQNILKKWRRDVVIDVTYSNIIEFLVTFYSLNDDNVIFYKSRDIKVKTLKGRKLKYVNLDQINPDLNYYQKYKDSCFIKKFMVKKDNSRIELNNLSNNPSVELYQGDAFKVLGSIDANTISGAVTSPPYYNARNYSVWPNIYCYLYDIYNIALEVFRVLEPGAPFLFNIFDYFDNEKSIVFSAMGKKRLILSSYIGYIFREVGFQYLGNCAWDKGEIQSNRNFNQGNCSPYYQAPHNCWEHIMIFSKGEPSFNPLKLPPIISNKPVFKISKGVNTYGHTAPYPKLIPKLLFSVLDDSKKLTVLDPFSGSMTTGRVAYSKGIHSINIELHKEYCDLSLSMLNSEKQCQESQLELLTYPI